MARADAPQVTNHRVHDYPHLIRRWRGVAATAGLRLQRLTSDPGDTTFFLRTPALGEQGGIYISAGIHGDEPGGTEGLITWAEKHARRLARWPFLLFPCLNPWGLINNRRSDAAGADRNRLFHRDDHPVLRGVKELAAGHVFDLALMLHEDYDGQGLYLYEIQRGRPLWGEELLEVARRHIAIDPRERIDGRASRAGLIRRRFDLRRFKQIGYPEAIWLHERHARRSLTIETPSEFAIEQRVRAHVAVLEECVRRVLRAVPQRPR